MVASKPGWESSPGPDPASRTTERSFLLFKVLVMMASAKAMPMEGKRGKEVGKKKDGGGKRREERKETEINGYTQIITNKSLLPLDAGYKLFTQSDLNRQSIYNRREWKC